jgi:hypothetical protein
MNEVAAEAKERGHKRMVGSVDEKGNGSENMKKIMEHLGFRQHSKIDSVWYFIKEI